MSDKFLLNSPCLDIPLHIKNKGHLAQNRNAFIIFFKTCKTKSYFLLKSYNLKEDNFELHKLFGDWAYIMFRFRNQITLSIL